MPYDFDVEGWEDWAGNVHQGKPTDIDDVMGTFSHFWDEETGDEHWHWVYIDPPAFDSWTEWYDLIGAIMEDHGYEF